MKYRMGAALLGLIGVLVSTYLYLFKLRLIPGLACGTGGCETVQASPWATFLGLPVALIGVGSTPSFLIAGRIYGGVQGSDQIVHTVDSLIAALPKVPARR